MRCILLLNRWLLQNCPRKSNTRKVTSPNTLFFKFTSTIFRFFVSCLNVNQSFWSICKKIYSILFIVSIWLNPIFRSTPKSFLNFINVDKYRRGNECLHIRLNWCIRWAKKNLILRKSVPFGKSVVRSVVNWARSDNLHAYNLLAELSGSCMLGWIWANHL